MPPYSGTLMEHILEPRNGGAMESPHAIGKASLGGRAPYVTVFLQASEGTVSKAMFQTFGCGVSIACCSVLTEIVLGKHIGECRSLSAVSLIEALGGIPAEKQFCADMAIEALQHALDDLPAARNNLES